MLDDKQWNSLAEAETAGLPGPYEPGTDAVHQISGW